MASNVVDVIPSLTQFNILGGDLEPMRETEVRWSKRAKLKTHPELRHLSSEEDRVLSTVLGRWGQAELSRCILAYPERTPGEGVRAAGCAVCVKSGEQLGLLTARHVLFDANGGHRFDQFFARFASHEETRCRASTEWNRRQTDVRVTSSGFTLPLAPETATVPTSRQEGAIVQPGLPDIALLRLNRELFCIAVETYKAQHGADSFAEPRWVDLQDLTSTVVGYDEAAGEKDEMHFGRWLVTGMSPESRNLSLVSTPTILLDVNRIYQRAGMSYYGMLHGALDRPEEENRDLHGTSGGGIWQQRLTPEGVRKVQTRCIDHTDPRRPWPRGAWGHSVLPRPPTDHSELPSRTAWTTLGSTTCRVSRDFPRRTQNWLRELAKADDLFDHDVHDYPVFRSRRQTTGIRAHPRWAILRAAAGDSFFYASVRSVQRTSPTTAAPSGHSRFGQSTLSALSLTSIQPASSYSTVRLTTNSSPMRMTKTLPSRRSLRPRSTRIDALSASVGSMDSPTTRIRRQRSATRFCSCSHARGNCLWAGPVFPEDGCARPLSRRTPQAVRRGAVVVGGTCHAVPGSPCQRVCFCFFGRC